MIYNCQEYVAIFKLNDCQLVINYIKEGKMKNWFTDSVLHEAFFDGNDAERGEDEGEGSGEAGGSPVTFLGAVGPVSPALSEPFAVDSYTLVAGYRLTDS